MPKQIDEDLLIKAAAEVFAERGYAGAGVAEIARRAGVTTGAIYSRYSGKSELLLEALKRSFVLHFGDAIASALSGENRAENFDQDGVGIRSIGLLANDEWKDHDALFLEAVVASRRDEEIATMLSQRLETAGTFLAKRIDTQKANGPVDSSFDTDALKTYALAMRMGFSVLRSLNYEMPDPDEWQTVLNQTQRSILKSPGEKNDNN
jgi:AcrR family transcriptional regulator